MQTEQDDRQVRLEQDTIFVNRILNNDKKAWEDFVVKYSDWVFYCAKHFTSYYHKVDNESTYRTFTTTAGKVISYSDETMDAYLWIFDKLRNKLKSYKGVCLLNSYIWSILNTKWENQYLRSDYRDWLFGNTRYIPAAITNKEDDNLTAVFKLLRRRKKTAKQIANKLSLSLSDAEKYISQVENLQKERKKNEVDSLKFTSIDKKIPAQQELDISELNLLNKVILKYFKAVKRLPTAQIILLELKYVKKWKSKEILSKCKEVRELHATSFSNVDSVDNKLEKIRIKLLKYFHEECTAFYPDIKITNQTVMTFLETIGVKENEK